MAEPQTKNSSITQRTLPTTKIMVNRALFEMHSRKGVTIRALIGFINTTYSIQVSGRRRTLLKEYLMELKDNGQVVEVSGKGFNAYFRLSNKRLFERDVIKQTKKPKPKPKPKRRQPSRNRQTNQRLNQQRTPTKTAPSKRTESIFKTPNRDEQVAMEPSLVTQAPRLNRLVRDVEKRFSRDMETPRSLPKNRK